MDMCLFTFIDANDKEGYTITGTGHNVLSSTQATPLQLHYVCYKTMI